LLLLAGAGYDIIDAEDQTSTGREREGGNGGRRILREKI
jgi:hypothetical protein